MSKITKITEYQGVDALPLVGANLLKDIEPIMISENGGHPEYKAQGVYDPTAYRVLTKDWKFDVPDHIDIFSENFTLTYDIGESLPIDRLFVSGFWFRNNSGVYMLQQYELHVSETMEEMYTEKSLVTAVDNTDISLEKTPRQAEVFFDCEGLSGRFVGFKMLKANVTDDITRLARIGAYNNKITAQRLFMSRILGENLLGADSITLPEGSRGETCSLCNGLVFDTNDAVTLSKGEVVLETAGEVEYLAAVGLIKDIEVYTSNSRDDLFSGKASGTLTPVDTNGEVEACYIYKFDVSKKYIGIKTADGAILEQLGLYTYTRKAEVDLDNIKTEDFIGIGANDIPMALMPESRMQGFRNVYWPLYCHRFGKANPSVVRVWFQVDWVVTEEEDYLQGICNFKSDKMRQFLPYLDAYEAAGIEVEFNFGWKTSTEIYEWFSIPSQGPQKNGGSGKSASAPRNFEGFAKCCAATVKYLCEEKGYSCIKHLTFYNEANYGDNPGSHDFGGYPGRAKEMWEVMLRAVDKELKANGSDKYVDYWLAEESGLDETELQWIDYMMKNCREFNSLNTFHRYARDYDGRLEYFDKVREHAGDVGAVATEFAVYTPPTWYQSNIEYVMSLLHSGLRGGLYWCLQTVKMTDPTWFYLGKGEGFWLEPPYEEEKWMENRQFYEFSLFTRYLPRHSKVLETYSPDEDIRIETVVTPDGNYTVFVESKASKFPKSVEVKFSTEIGKTFYKHTYNPEVNKPDGNMTVPPAEKEIQVGDTLRDFIGRDYQLVCYTTLPPYKQIKLNQTKFTLPLGEEFKLEATTIDCEGEIVWEVVASDGVPCKLSTDGVVSAAELTCKGDVHCIAARLKDCPEVCSMAIVKFA